MTLIHKAGSVARLFIVVWLDCKRIKCNMRYGCAHLTIPHFSTFSGANKDIPSFLGCQKYPLNSFQSVATSCVEALE